MRKTTKWGKVRLRKSDSFTLIELLTVMAIIAILAALILGAGMGVMTKASRSRASAEIQAMSAGLEGYKTDNGIYPTVNPALGNAGVSTSLVTNTAAAPYASDSKDGTGADYQQNSQILYQALSGQTNFVDGGVPGMKVYMTFRRNQVGDLGNGSYVKDPWGYSYGYFPGNIVGGTQTNAPYAGTGFYDIWSTGGLLSPKATNSAAWLSNWTQ